MEQLLLFPECAPRGTGPPLLSEEEQRQVLEGLLSGGSPQVVCGRLRVPAEAFSRTVREDIDFRRRLRAVRELMTQNVVATLYAAAIKGTASAQTLWLKTFPPGPASDDHVGDGAGERTDDDIEQFDEQDLREWLALQQFGRWRNDA